MNYCQFRNETIKRMCNTGGGSILPREYQQVEYLQSTGLQIIDTGITATNSLKITTKFGILDGFTFSNAAFIFGSYIQNKQGCSIAIVNSTTIRVGDANVSSFINVNARTTISQGEIYDITQRAGEITIDGQTIYTGGIGSNSVTVYLFGRHDVGTPGGSFFTPHMRIYYACLGTADNAAEYRDLYPCYRKADNVTGMYDLINNEFIPYTGTANFITGNNV